MKRLGFASIALSMLLLAGCGMQSAPEVQSTLQDQISLYCLDHEGNLEMREAESFMCIVSLLMEVNVLRQISLMECARRERFLVRQAKDEKFELCRRMRLQKSR